LSEFFQQFLSNVASPITCAILALLIASICRRDLQRRRDDFLVTFGIATFSAIGIQLHWLIVKLTPTMIDARLLNIDRALGFDPNQFAAWVHGQHSRFYVVLLGAYVALPLVIALVWIIERNRLMFRALLVGAMFCWFFYLLFPAVGPIYYSHQVSTNIPRNCIPSMHFTWGLLLALNARSWLRWPLWVYASLVGVSTIALGQHYLIDLIVALPYTAAVQIAAIVSLRNPELHAAPVVPASDYNEKPVENDTAFMLMARSIKKTTDELIEN
jgi:membrane-associated phospholipid phosphatase